MTQGLLGLELDAPNGRIYLDAELPSWLGDLTLKNVRMAEQRFDIHFARSDAGATTFEVRRGDAAAVEYRPMGARSLHLAIAHRDVAAGAKGAILK